MPVKISSAGGGSAQLPAGVPEGVLRYTTSPISITASSAPPGGGDTVTINGTNNTVTVAVKYGADTLETKTYTIPSATYPGLGLLAYGAGGAAVFQYAISNASPSHDSFARLSSGWSQPDILDFPSEMTATDYDPYGPPALWARVA